MSDIFRVEMLIEPFEGFEKNEVARLFYENILFWGYTLLGNGYEVKAYDRLKDSPFENTSIIPKLDVATFDIRYDNDIDPKKALACAYKIDETYPKFKYHGADFKIFQTDYYDKQ